jgi:hypothetical protein
MIFQKGVTESPHKFKMIAYDAKTDINNYQNEDIEPKNKTFNKNQMMHKSSQYFNSKLSLDEETTNINPQ